MRVLDRILCICYLVQFQKDKNTDILALLNFVGKINAIILAYTAQLGLKVQKTDVGTQKIDKSLLATYGMIIAAFQVVNKLGCSWFFQKTFLPANISMGMVFSMLFLIFSNTDVQFAEKELTWRTYTTKKALPTTHQV